MWNRDFKEFAECLHAEGVEYLLVGGYALAAHGHPRHTGDIDFWLRATPDNLARVLNALSRFGFASLGLALSDFDADSVIQLGHPPHRIDLLCAIDGVDFEACWQRRERVRVGDIEIPLIARADFVANKRASGRLKDLADVEALAPDPPDPPLA